MALSYGFALNAADSSASFSNALSSIIGDGVTPQGGRFGWSVNGFTVSLSSGYGYGAGRYLKNDEPYPMPLGPPKNNEDRTDALALLVDYRARRAELGVIADVDPVKIRETPSLMRDGERYVVYLYFVCVRRGATSLTPEDVTDLRDEPSLCGRVIPLSAIAGDVLYVYSFLTGGIDKEVARLIAKSNLVIDKANTAIAELDAQIKKAGGGAETGELMTSRHAPSETGWLLCDGGAVPAEYEALSALLDGRLPALSNPDDRYKVYIFAGEYTGT